MQQDPISLHSLYNPTPVASIFFQNIQNTDNSPMNNGRLMGSLSVFCENSFIVSLTILYWKRSNGEKAVLSNGVICNISGVII